LATLGAYVACYRSAEELLDSVDFDKAACLVTEVHLPGMSGLDLLKTLRGLGVGYPVIVMTSDADTPMAMRAMSLGAMDFIEKPFVDRVLIARVRQALQLVA
jgi:two-component system response regulator FixJ